MAESRRPEVNQAYLEIVENQLRDNNPPEVRVTLDRLIASGLTRNQAVYQITLAVEAEVKAVLQTMKPFDEARYLAALRALPASPE
jgi:hypothetical protein